MGLDRNRLPEPLEYYMTHVAGLKSRPNMTAWAPCPFHKERTASFKVNLESGRYWCFGCGEKGADVIAFHQRFYGKAFLDAVKDLGAWR
jgi:DNA primase